jgi:hypothetical protein
MRLTLTALVLLVAVRAAGRRTYGFRIRFGTGLSR